MTPDSEIRGLDVAAAKQRVLDELVAEARREAVAAGKRPRKARPAKPKRDGRKEKARRKAARKARKRNR